MKYEISHLLRNKIIKHIRGRNNKGRDKGKSDWNHCEDAKNQEHTISSSFNILLWCHQVSRYKTGQYEFYRSFSNAKIHQSRRDG